MSALHDTRADVLRGGPDAVAHYDGLLQDFRAVDKANDFHKPEILKLLKTLEAATARLARIRSRLMAAVKIERPARLRQACVELASDIEAMIEGRPVADEQAPDTVREGRHRCQAEECDGRCDALGGCLASPTSGGQDGGGTD